jgi:hypothetical protein
MAWSVVRVFAFFADGGLLIDAAASLAAASFLAATSLLNLLNRLWDRCQE